MYIVGATSCIALNQSKAADKNHRAAPSKSERSERSSATVSKYTSWAFVFSIILLDAAVNAIYPQVAINTGASRTIMAECLILTGIGGIIGASLAKYFGGQQSARTMTSAMVLAAIATPLLVSLAYISQFPIALLYAGLLISGMSLSMVLVIATTCLQTASFGDKKANEGAIRNLLIGIGSVAGPLLAAVLSSKFNYTFAITIIGGLSILTPLIFFGNSLPLFRLKRG
jgi:predicted MFS family arabinose efflux permease